MRYVMLLVLFNVALLPSVLAEDILSLQQKASFAYEQMKQAEREAESAKQQIEITKERLRYFKQKLAEAEQELEIANEESNVANTRMEDARRQWDNLSSTLSQEWQKHESSR
jgi:5-bromo-4-chloroindolyl phosphate hydrolysis protein